MNWEHEGGKREWVKGEGAGSVYYLQDSRHFNHAFVVGTVNTWRGVVWDRRRADWGTETAVCATKEEAMAASEAILALETL